MFLKKNSNSFYPWAILGAVAEALYCLLIAWLMPKLGALVGQGQGVLQIAPFLLVLVFSVAISGLFMFGLPARLSMEQKYAQAVTCFFISLATLAVIGLIIFLII